VEIVELSKSRDFPFLSRPALYAANSFNCCIFSVVSRSLILTTREDLDGDFSAPGAFRDNVTHVSLSFFPCIWMSLPRSYVSVDPSTLFVVGHKVCRLTVNLIPALGFSSTLFT